MSDRIYNARVAKKKRRKKEEKKEKWQMGGIKIGDTTGGVGED
jgi:hypothetical protein